MILILYAFCLALLMLAGVGLYTVLWRERADEQTLWADDQEDWQESPRIISLPDGWTASSDGHGLSAVGSASGAGIHVSREVAKRLVDQYNAIEDFRESIGLSSMERIEWHDRKDDDR